MTRNCAASGALGAFLDPPGGMCLPAGTENCVQHPTVSRNRAIGEDVY